MPFIERERKRDSSLSFMEDKHKRVVLGYEKKMSCPPTPVNKERESVCVVRIFFSTYMGNKRVFLDPHVTQKGCSLIPK